MHQLIMDWSSRELYDRKIEAHASVAAHTLYDLDDVQKTYSIEPTLILIDIDSVVIWRRKRRTRKSQ